MSNQITAAGLCALVAALEPPIIGRVRTVPETVCRGAFYPLTDGRAGITMTVGGLPRCTVLAVEVWDSGDPPIHVWTIDVQRVLSKGEKLTAVLVAG